MTTTGRPSDQPQHPKLPTSCRPDGDRSAPAVARIQGVELHGAFVDEITLPLPGNYRLCSRMVSGVWEHTIELADPAEALMAAGRRIAQSLAHMGRELDKAAEAMQQLGLLATQPPTDAKSRALWLRQHRNTGPTQQRHRAPKTLGRTR